MAVTEAERIRAVYQERDRRGKAGLYAWHRQEVLLNQYRLSAAAARLLGRAGFHQWAEKDVLDVGCGSGTWLTRVIEWGGDPGRLHGTDVLHDRIEQARRRAPHVDWRVNEDALPYADESMDLVSAHTVFSSILDRDVRTALASEMLRVTRPSGWLLVYDFRVSHPGNPDTTAIRTTEIRRLFPSLPLYTQSLTLAPPIARRLATHLPAAALLLEAGLPCLRTHRVYVLKKR